MPKDSFLHDIAAKAARASEGLAHADCIRTLSMNALGADWRATGSKVSRTRAAWEGRLAHSSQIVEFSRRMARSLPEGYEPALMTARAAPFDAPQRVTIHKASQIALAPALPELIGGSADRTGSNPTRFPAMDSQFSAETPGRYIGCGMGEFGMAEAIHGMKIRGGPIRYGGVFLLSSDDPRGAIRLSALMEVGTIHVMPHDSIGLGEDGPALEPIEHPTPRRAISNLVAFRSADAVGRRRRNPLHQGRLCDPAVGGRARPDPAGHGRQGQAGGRTLPQLRDHMRGGCRPRPDRQEG